MVNYIQLYKIKKKVKSMLKEKLALGELATTPSSCLDCLATDLSWEMYYKRKNDQSFFSCLSRRIFSFASAHQAMRLVMSFSNPMPPGS